MVARPTPPLMTVDEYLQLERSGDTKHEYIDGYVYAQAGGTKGHSVLGGNIVTTLNNYLPADGPCRVYNSGMRVRLSPTRYVYPDATMSCDERDNAGDDEEDEIHYPRLIAEVLSKSTEEYDRTDKFELYAACATLQDYVLVNARRRSVHMYSRGENGAWTVRVYGPTEEIVLPSLDLRVPIADFYRAVRLPAGPQIGPT